MTECETNKMSRLMSKVKTRFDRENHPCTQHCMRPKNCTNLFDHRIQRVPVAALVNKRL